MYNMIFGINCMPYPASTKIVFTVFTIFAIHTNLSLIVLNGQASFIGNLYPAYCYKPNGYQQNGRVFHTIYMLGLLRW